MPTARRPVSGLILSTLFWLLALPVFGAVSTDGEERDLTAISLEELAQTKVTSVSKTEAPRFRTPAAVHVLTAEDIERSGATSIPEALRGVPGIHVARINSNQWAVGIRGFTSRLARSQLALMDGRSLYTPLFAGTYWETQDTFLEDVERIEIVRGPGGTLWGANAVNGIVNILTKDARDTQGWLASGGAGNEERGFLRVRYGGKAGEDGHYRVYGKYFSRDAQFHPDGDTFDDWHLAQGGFRSDWTVGGDRLTVQGDLYRRKVGERVNLTFYEPPYTRRLEADGELSGGNLTTHWDHAFSASKLSVLAYYDRTRRVEPSFREVRDTFDVDLQHQVGFGGRHELVWGLGYRLSSGRSGGIETVRFVPPSRTDHIVSAFAQDEIDVVKDRLHLSLGTKLERNQYKGFEVQPSGRVVWMPRPRQAVWAAVTRAVRTPSRVERDLVADTSVSPTSPTFARILGDEGFTAERVVAYEAGYRIQPADRLTLELALFHNSYGDLLSIENGQPFVENGRLLLPLRIQNLLRGRTSGLELESRGQLSARWVVHASYAYLNMNLEAKPGSTDRSSVSAERASPRHRVRLQSSWSLPRDVDVDVSFRWVDKLALPAQRIDAFSGLDARVAWRVVPRLQLAVVGQNLLQAHHAEFASTPPPIEIERSIYGEARWGF